MTALIDFASFCHEVAVELDLPFHDDVALDSLLRFEILLLVEDWTGVMLPDGLIAHLQTLDDFYDIYCTRVSQQYSRSGKH